jgi:predicted DNA-binding ArsR family transcriptional regulator
MKRVKLINDPAELVALFRAVDSEGRRNVLTTLAEGWTMISDLVSEHGEEAYGAITYFEKFKLVESRWEVNSETGRPEKGYRTFYNAFQISTSLTFDETQELLTVVLMTEKKFKSLEAKIVELIGTEGTFANDVARDLGVSSLTLKGLVRRSVEFDFKGHNIVPLKEEE